MSLLVPRRIAEPASTSTKAGPVGFGAGVLQTEFPLGVLLGRSPQQKMRKAYQLGISVPWIRAAERVIAGRISSVGWHLEDAEEQEIDDQHADDMAQEARTLIARPTAALPIGQQMPRSRLWWLTARHTGLCGSGFWFLDELNGYGIPRSTLYVRPDRMYPVEDKAGNLLAWDIKDDPNAPGVRVSLEQVMHFMFEPPDQGHFGIGLVESALIKAQNTVGLDKHLAQIIAAGGRLAGILSPKEGALNDDQYGQLVRDTRSIVEQPDAAKRVHIIRGPVEFTQTTMNQQEMALVELMTKSADDLLALWGVPKSMLGLHDRGRGMGASEVTTHDEETLWKTAIHPRLGNNDQGGMVETIQGQLLDRYTDAGVPVTLCIDEPAFDDESAKYEQAQKAALVPMRSAERRAIVGLEPFGPDVRDPETGILLDDEVWMPATMVKAFAAPTDGTAIPKPEPEPEPTILMSPAARLAGETGDGMTMPGRGRAKPTAEKANANVGASLRTLREQLASRVAPKLAASVGTILAEQRAEIASKVRAFASHVAAKPADSSIWWDGAKWDRRMREAVRPHLTTVAASVTSHIGAIVPPMKAELRQPSHGDAALEAMQAAAITAASAAEQSAFIDDVLGRVLDHGGARITAINERTRAAVQAQIEQAVREGVSPAELADRIEAGVVLDNGAPAFDEYRAELIGRTELADVYRDSELSAYRGLGVEMVEALDGDKDEVCAARNGRTFTVEEADSITDHPNGTLDWLPSFAEPPRRN